MNTSPAVPVGGRSRALRLALFASIPVAAIAIAFLATRKPSQSAGADSAHAHGAAPIADSAKSVMLSAAEAQRIGVTYAVVTAAPLGREIRTVGQVTFDETRVTTVSLKIDGWVEQLMVNYGGQIVAVGTPLLAIYSPMLVTAQEELLLAKRLESDVAGGAEDARANAASLVNSARRRLSYWGVTAEDIGRIESTGRMQRTITLRSSVRGFVIEKNVLEGQRVMAGEAIYRIADLSVVWVEGEVFERDLSAVRLGQTVAAEFDALAGRELHGRIAYVYPTLNADTRTSRVRVAFSNPGFQLKPGMYATLRWTGSGAGSALVVPRGAVLSTGERHLVFVQRADGMLEPRLVQVGAASDDRIEILRGLVAGERVVASATFLVDAESNLSSVLGGMGKMPGMDIVAPKKPE